MSWFATDDGFWSHRKTMRMRASPYYCDAVALWTLAGSWCCDQEDEQHTGTIPLDVLDSLGVKRWKKALDLLVAVGLWEIPNGDVAQFHDWPHWNGPEARANRSREKGRKRTADWRIRKCERGEHDGHCPPETCPEKQGAGDAPGDGG